MAVLYKSRCPHCNALINIEVRAQYKWVDEEIKEPKIYRCKKCGGLISSGESEWNDKDDREKSDYVSRQILSGAVTSILVGFTLAFFTTGFLVHWVGVGKNYFGYIFITFIIFYIGGLAILLYKSHKKEIRDSIERTSKRVEIKHIKYSIQESEAEPTIKQKMIPGLTPAENSIYNDYKEMIQNDGNPNIEDILAKLKKKHKLNNKYITNAIEQGKKYERTSS